MLPPCGHIWQQQLRNLCGRALHYLPGLQEFNEKTPVLNKCPRMRPGKRSQKRADGQEANLNRLVLLTLFFLITRKASTPCSLTKTQTKTPRCCLTRVKMTFVKKFTNNECWKVLERREFSCTDATKLNC